MHPLEESVFAGSQSGPVPFAGWSCCWLSEVWPQVLIWPEEGRRLTSLGVTPAGRRPAWSQN